MLRTLAIAAAACLPGELRAGPDELWHLLRLDDLIEVMAEEGRDYGATLAADLFDQGGGPTWDARVASLYDADTMAAEIRPGFVAAFEGVDTAELERFFASDLGRRIVRYEIEARRAFLDPEVEAAAAESFDALERGDPRRYALIEEFIRVNDLVETNVASSLTFTYAFNLGLVEGGMADMSKGDALADAWSQEDEVRQDTLRWLEAQLSVSMAPLSDAEVRDYIDLSETTAGGVLNAALFQAFEPAFARIARGLGEGVARSMGGRDI
jgi:hypothetical protein